MSSSPTESPYPDEPDPSGDNETDAPTGKAFLDPVAIGAVAILFLAISCIILRWAIIIKRRWEKRRNALARSTMSERLRDNAKQDTISRKGNRTIRELDSRIKHTPSVILELRKNPMLYPAQGTEIYDISANQPHSFIRGLLPEVPPTLVPIVPSAVQPTSPSPLLMTDPEGLSSGSPSSPITPVSADVRQYRSTKLGGHLNRLTHLSNTPDAAGLRNESHLQDPQALVAAAKLSAARGNSSMGLFHPDRKKEVYSLLQLREPTKKSSMSLKPKLRKITRKLRSSVLSSSPNHALPNDFSGITISGPSNIVQTDAQSINFHDGADETRQRRNSTTKIARLTNLLRGSNKAAPSSLVAKPQTSVVNPLIASHLAKSTAASTSLESHAEEAPAEGVAISISPLASSPSSASSKYSAASPFSPSPLFSPIDATNTTVTRPSRQVVMSMKPPPPPTSPNAQKSPLSRPPPPLLSPPVVSQSGPVTLAPSPHRPPTSSPLTMESIPEVPEVPPLDPSQWRDGLPKALLPVNPPLAPITAPIPTPPPLPPAAAGSANTTSEEERPRLSLRIPPNPHAGERNDTPAATLAPSVSTIAPSFVQPLPPPTVLSPLPPTLSDPPTASTTPSNTVTAPTTTAVSKNPLRARLVQAVSSAAAPSKLNPTSANVIGQWNLLMRPLSVSLLEEKVDITDNDNHCNSTNSSVTGKSPTPTFTSTSRNSMVLQPVIVLDTAPKPRGMSISTSTSNTTSTSMQGQGDNDGKSSETSGRPKSVIGDQGAGSISKAQLTPLRGIAYSISNASSTISSTSTTPVTSTPPHSAPSSTASDTSVDITAGISVASNTATTTAANDANANDTATPTSIDLERKSLRRSNPLLNAGKKPTMPKPAHMSHGIGDVPNSLSGSGKDSSPTLPGEVARQQPVSTIEMEVFPHPKRRANPLLAMKKQQSTA